MHKNNPSKECILCGRCLEVCPVFKVTVREELSPRGKGFLLAQYHESGIGVKQTMELAELCAGCKRCLVTCPQNIDLPLEIARLKSAHPDWKSWIWSRIIKTGPGLLPAIKGARALVPDSIPILKYPLQDNPPVPALFNVIPELQVNSKRAVVFPGCLGKHFRPDLEQNAVRLLRNLGYETIETPGWQCCGFPFGSAGLFEQEKKEITNNIDLWQTMDRPLIFVFCATCQEGLTNPFSGPGRHPLWGVFQQNVIPLIKLLSNLKAEPVVPAQSRMLIWHQPCHGTENSGKIFQNILKKSGHELIISDNKCCGMGGSFALQNPGLSSRIASDFWQSIPGKDEVLVMTDCNGCVLQLGSVKPEHANVAHWLNVFSVGP